MSSNWAMIVWSCALIAPAVSRPQHIHSGQTIEKKHQPGLEPYWNDPADYRFEYHNPDFTDDGEELFEGDIVLTEDRQATRNLWTSPVKFAIRADLAHKRENILAGIQHWRDHTCIEFEEVPEGSSEKHLSFFKGNSCSSLLGMTKGSGAQKISIGNGCAGLSVVAHEIGHAMGLHHQQSRADRDTYVTIRFENIKPGKEGNFKRADNSLNYSVPYDYTSVMHYGRKFFSVNGESTIATNNVLYEDLIGTRNGLSHRDQHIINLMYQCAASCVSPPACQNGGFVGKDCTCVCPSNTDGADCEIVNGDYYPPIDCGSVDMTTPGTIATPQYPEHSPDKVTCWWVINAGQGQKVKVTITDMSLSPPRNDGNCKRDKLILRYNGDDYHSDQKACGDQLKGQSFISVSNRFIVKFVTAGTRQSRGFSAEVEFLD